MPYSVKAYFHRQDDLNVVLLKMQTDNEKIQNGNYLQKSLSTEQNLNQGKN